MSKKIMTYPEAIEIALLEGGYFAPLKKIYKEIVKYRPLTGKTPFNTIQAIVQRDPRFKRIGLGIYALTEHLDKLPKTPIPKTKEQRENNIHTSIQGMLLEIGNVESYDTYSWEKSPVFENKNLSKLMTLDVCPVFTYKEIVKRIERIDVLWFKKGFPKFAFEVENTPQFLNSLVKFAELSNFCTIFYLIARAENEEKYEKEINRPVFEEIKGRCRFKSYETVQDMYYKSVEKMTISREFFET